MHPLVVESVVESVVVESVVVESVVVESVVVESVVAVPGPAETESVLVSDAVSVSVSVDSPFEPGEKHPSESMRSNHVKPRRLIQSDPRSTGRDDNRCARGRQGSPHLAQRNRSAFFDALRVSKPCARPRGT
jgi:hypothetical protein